MSTFWRLHEPRKVKSTDAATYANVFPIHQLVVSSGSIELQKFSLVVVCEIQCNIPYQSKRERVMSDAIPSNIN